MPPPPAAAAKPKASPPPAAAAKPKAGAPAAAAAKPKAGAPAAALPAPAKAGAAAPVKAAAARASKAGSAPPRAAASAAAPSAPSAAASTEAAAAAAAAEAAAEAAAAAAAAAAAEAAGTGAITVVYCESSPTFTIAGGQLTAEAIDDTLALTHAYPGCAIHLTQAPVRGNDWRTVDWTRLEARSPEGLFSGLLAGARYWAAVVEDGAERARYEAQQRERRAAFAARAAAAAAAARCSELTTDYQLSLEACSCIEGNPCAVPECCQDFSGRFENARRVLEDRRRRKEDQAASLGGGGGSGSGAVSLAEKERLQREGMDRLAGHSYKKL